MRELTRSEVADQLRSLGVRAGGVLLVHTSFRAVRPIEAGPAGLIAALQDALGEEGTLVMPSWPDNDQAPFDPQQTAAAKDLGVVADTFWRMPGVLRSDHPQAFAAAGPLAAQITRDPLPLPPHIPASPVGRVRDLDGQVLLLGVDHQANTTLHLAELIADVPYRLTKHCTVFENGNPIRIEYQENDHCCEGFALAETWLQEKGLQQDGHVGHARAKLMRAQAVLQVAVDRLRKEPLIFLHPADAGCEECDAARQSVPASSH